MLNDAGEMQVLGIVSVCPDTSPLQVMKLRAQQLFSTQPQPDDLPQDIPDLGTLGNYLLTRHVPNSSLRLCHFTGDLVECIKPSGRVPGGTTLLLQ